MKAGRLLFGTSELRGKRQSISPFSIVRPKKQESFLSQFRRNRVGLRIGLLFRFPIHILNCESDLSQGRAGAIVMVAGLLRLGLLLPAVPNDMNMGMPIPMGALEGILTST